MDKHLFRFIDVFTLAEKTCFWNLIFNALGWKPKPTYDILKFGRVYDIDQPKKTLDRFVENHNGIAVKHLFKPFMLPELEVYMRKYYDDAFELIKLILSGEKSFPVIWDFNLADKETLNELQVLYRQSPPLYDKLMKRFANQFRKKVHETIADAVLTEIDDFESEHYGADYHKILILLSPGLDEIYAYCDTEPDQIDAKAFEGWSMETITDLKQIASITEKYCNTVADGLLSPFLKEQN